MFSQDRPFAKSSRAFTFRSNISKGSFVLFLCAFPFTIFADVIATTLPPDDSYCVGCGNATIGGGAGDGLGYGQNFAVQFAASTTDLLGQIDVAVSLVSGENTLVISLLADSDNRPGTVLESMTVDGQMQGTPSSTSIVSAESVLHPTLVASDLYWIEVSVPDPINDFASWYSNDLNISGTTAFSPSIFPGDWSVGPDPDLVAYEVTSASTVPEPKSSGILLLFAGFFGVAMYKRRPLGPTRVS